MRQPNRVSTILLDIILVSDVYVYVCIYVQCMYVCIMYVCMYVCILHRIVDNARKRELGFNTQPTQCTTCMQFFSKMNMHVNNAEDSITGCYNVARLRMYICLRKNIPLPPSLEWLIQPSQIWKNIF